MRIVTGSAVLSASDKDKFERYYTPASVVNHHVRYEKRFVPDNPQTHPDLVFFDPFSGDGRYAAAVARAKYTTSDVVEGDLVETGDHWGATLARVDGRSFCCVTNPAFSEATAFVEAVARHVAHHRPSFGLVSLLLPSSFLEPTRDREELFQARPPSRITFIGRVRFEGPAIEVLNEKRAAKGQGPAGGAAMSYVLVDWTWVLGYLVPPSPVVWARRP